MPGGADFKLPEVKGSKLLFDQFQLNIFTLFFVRADRLFLHCSMRKKKVSCNMLFIQFTTGLLKYQ